MSTCRSCGASIRWAITERSGKRIPVDAEPVAEGGNLLLTTDDPPIARVVSVDQLVIDDGVRFVSHFATCPNADAHRRS